MHGFAVKGSGVCRKTWNQLTVLIDWHRFKASQLRCVEQAQTALLTKFKHLFYLLLSYLIEKRMRNNQLSFGTLEPLATAY